MLTDRQNFILSTIIELYEEHGEPIGSKTLLAMSELDYSSATIRNDMKALEEAGLLEKTHTSSGRIPTDEGYRYYAKRLIESQEDDDRDNRILRESRRTRLYEILGQSYQQIDDIVNVTASILSQLTSYTAIVLGPEATKSHLVGFKFVPINAKYATGILITDSGNVDSMTFELPADIRANDIEKMVNIIENELVGLTLIEAYQKIQVLVPELMKRYASTAYSLLEDVTRTLEKTLTHPIRVSGRINLFDAFENMEFDKVKRLYAEMDNNASLAKLLSHASDQGVNIKIGSELDSDLLQDFTLISTNYNVSDHGHGLIAILGPSKMPYSMTIELLEDVALILPEVFNKFYGDEE